MKQSEYKLYNSVEEFHWWFKARREALNQLIVNIEDINKKSVLDVGCGTGGNLSYLYNSFKITEGIDNNPKAVLYAKNKSGCNIILHDANELSKLKKKYDLVSFLDVLYHKDIS